MALEIESKNLIETIGSTYNVLQLNDEQHAVEGDVAIPEQHFSSQLKEKTNTTIFKRLNNKRT